MLNRSLLSPYLPVDFLRGAGMLALSSIRPLRRFIMEQGIGRPVAQDRPKAQNGLQRFLSRKSS
jgi:2-octaprenyl-6-methoxyphenol hydroxylase